MGNFPSSTRVSVDRREPMGVFRWAASLSIPLVVVYLLTEHPQLTRSALYGFRGPEILLVHGGLVALIAVISLLFSRSRATLVALLTIAFSIGLPKLTVAGYDPDVSSLAFLASGICLIAAPEKRVFRITSLIWVGLAAIFGTGLLTVGEMYGRSYTNFIILICVSLWGLITIGLRSKQSAGSGESLMMSCLVGASFAGWTYGLGAQSLSQTGFQALCLLASVPSLASVVEHSFRLAYIDELTEIPGRRALVESMQDSGDVFTLAMLDVDHFKKFNDTHGHEVGE